MKLGRAPPRALFLCLLFALLCLASSRAHAENPTNPPVGGGGTCTQTTASGGYQAIQWAFNNGLYGCSSGSVWVPEALLVGSSMGDGTSASCNSTNAGMVEYLSGNLQVCNGSTWTSLAGGNNSGTQYQIAYYATTGTQISGDSHITTDSSNDLNLTAGAYELQGVAVLNYPYSNTDTTSIAVGNSALTSQSANTLNNTAMGYLAGEYISSGASNTAIGEGAMEGTSGTLLTGSNNTALGVSALLKAQGAATGNTAVGQASLDANTTGANNTALGASALGANTTGVNSTALGYGALFTATTGTNSALGYKSGAYISTGSANTAIGTGAMRGISGTLLTGSNNTAVGDSVLLVVQGAAAGNTAVGQASLTANTTGADNAAFGANALLANTTGANSTAVGYNALATSTTTTNSALGYDAGQYISTGNANTAVGNLALQGVSATPVTGNYNTAVGDSALLAIQGAANEDTAIGADALDSCTTCASNTAVGYLSQNKVTTGNSNTSLGYNSLSANQTGIQNMAIGQSSLSNETGSDNTAVGWGSNLYATSAADNVSIGYESLEGVSATPLTGSYNTALGDLAIKSLQGAGAGNVAVGYQAGYSGTALTTGTNNVYIGYNAAANGATDTNEIVIGEATTGGGSNTTVIGNSSQTTLTVGGTGSLIVPVGTTGQRPNTTTGQFRYNSTTGAFEGYNGTSWVTISTSGNGAWTLIATQTASSSASLQWTGLGSTYNTLFINCNGLIMSASGNAPKLIVGEGATPTWETGLHYTVNQNYTFSNQTIGEYYTTTNSDPLSFGTVATTFPVSIKAYIDNISSTTLPKTITYTDASLDSANSEYIYQAGFGYWNSDTNAVTAIEIAATAGTITSGQCSLYGINN
jgi:hypothetical protein